MKRQQDIVLKVENPCSQSWGSMQNGAAGKYCLHCSKNVVDFTGMTDDQIIRVVTQKNSKLCGRLDTKQLNRILLQNPDPGKELRAGKWLAGTMLLLGVADSVAADTMTGEKTEIVWSQQVSANVQMPKEQETISDSLKIFFRGKVVDRNNYEAMPFVGVQLVGTTLATTTDFDGKFSIRIPADQIRDTMVFEFRYVGYSTVRVPVKKEKLVSDFDKSYSTIELKLDEIVMMGEVIVVKKKKWWQFWK